MNDNKIHLQYCKCGRTPKIIKSKGDAGQGGTYNQYHVECDCGMRTVTKDNFYSELTVSEQDVINIVTIIWNNDRMVR